jgi:5-methylthioadenosine/S-adenosylhomocysteine deaminase
MSSLAMPAGAAVSPAVGRLPGRSNVVIRNAYVMTMVPGAADLPNGDVRVANGEIAEVGTGLSAPGGPGDVQAIDQVIDQVIDGEGFILMPGLVDTHWHMWTTLLRNMAGNTPEHGYFPTTTAIGNVYTPRDMYYGTLLSAAEALFSGITTVHDWCHNIITPEHAEEDLRALQETGIRGRFSYGPARRMPSTEAIDVGDLTRFARDWKSLSNEGLLTLGLGWRGVQAPFRLPDGAFELRPLPEAVYRKEHDAARRLGLPISVHLNSTANDRGHIMALQKQGLLVRDLQIIHGIFSTAEEMKALAQAGAVASVSPYAELRIGFGVTKILEYLDNGVTSDINMGPFTDPAHMLVASAQAWNVDTVMVDGRILKRNGRLTAIDTAALMTEASRASRDVRGRAKWW